MTHTFGRYAAHTISRTFRLFRFRRKFQFPLYSDDSQARTLPLDLRYIAVPKDRVDCVQHVLKVSYVNQWHLPPYAYLHTLIIFHLVIIVNTICNHSG